MPKRLLLVVGLALGLALAGSAPAGAQEADDGYPPSVFFLTLSDTTVVPGQTITASGALTPGSTSVSFTFFSQPVSIGSTTPNADGTFTTSLTIPSDADLGSHTITATDSAGVSVSAGVEVVASGQAGAEGEQGVTVTVPGTAAGALPRTGDDSLPLLRIGAVLLAGGGLLVFLTRRRRDEQVDDQAPASL
jgi:LPXTG-motif cell wall-anchored protein